MCGSIFGCWGAEAGLLVVVDIHGFEVLFC